jgi:hypothetical protein
VCLTAGCASVLWAMGTRVATVSRDDGVMA